MSEQIDIRLVPRFDGARTPMVWCHGCFRERVPFSWRESRSLCDDCKADEARSAA